MWTHVNFEEQVIIYPLDMLSTSSIDVFFFEKEVNSAFKKFNNSLIQIGNTSFQHKHKQKKTAVDVHVSYR
jgi:hypothetical protein